MCSVICLAVGGEFGDAFRTGGRKGRSAPGADGKPGQRDPTEPLTQFRDTDADVSTTGVC